MTEHETRFDEYNSLNKTVQGLAISLATFSEGGGKLDSIMVVANLESKDILVQELKELEKLGWVEKGKNVLNSKTSRGIEFVTDSSIDWKDDGLRIRLKPEVKHFLLTKMIKL